MAGRLVHLSDEAHKVLFDLLRVNYNQVAPGVGNEVLQALDQAPDAGDVPELAPLSDEEETTYQALAARRNANVPVEAPAEGIGL
jgi:hypothetical protein